MSTTFPSTSMQSAQADARVTSNLPIDLGLRAYVARFASLAVPSETQLHGRFRARFVGPAWLRLSAGPSVGLAGLRAWWGKELAGFGAAHNLVQRDGQLVCTLPMQLGLGSSLVDGRPCAVLRYGPESPFPWPRVIDELRALDDDHLLGMTVIDAPGLRRLSFPFLLVREA